MTAIFSSRRVGGMALLASLVFSLASAAVAQPPDILRSYRFLPRLSTLNETGGFAGVDIDYTMRGTFDLATGYDVDKTGFHQKAEFTNVDAWASHPVLAYVLNVDEVLGLTMLAGTALPVAAPFDVFQFTGKNEQGMPVELYAAQIGDWLLMRGETSPPCCDFFKYRVRAIARQRSAADLNEDGEVDGRDVARWAAGFGQPAAVDVNGDGVLDGGDFLALQRQMSAQPPDFGQADAMLSAMIAAGATVSAVPEPAAYLLVAVGMVLALIGVRARR
ncbi:MAG: hypothetical protein KDA44_07685 [Planctomycetales bacterium]|nr:hypothetical protein [Planctomycetales bacterium]